MGAATQQLHHHRPLTDITPARLDRLAKSGPVEADAPPGPAAAEISTAIVGLMRSRCGRGPTKAKTVVTPDLAVVTLDDCLTRAEETLVDQGQHLLVTEVRDVLYEAGVLAPDSGPIHAIMRGVVEVLAHQSPALGEHFAEFFVPSERQLRGEGNAGRFGGSRA